MGKTRVIISEKDSYNLSAFNQIITDIGKDMGCEACHSGRPIDFLIEEQIQGGPEAVAPKEDEAIYRLDKNTGKIIKL